MSVRNGGEKWRKEAVFVGFRTLSQHSNGGRKMHRPPLHLLLHLPLLSGHSPASEIGSAGEWEIIGRKERDLVGLTVP